MLSTENKLKRKRAHIEKVRSLSKVQKKMENFFLKELTKKKKKKNETTEQEQNISLNPKEIKSRELL